MNSRLAVGSGFLRLTPALPSQIYKECYLHVCVSKGSAQVERKGEGGGREEEACIEMWPYKENSWSVSDLGEINICQLLTLPAFDPLVSDLYALHDLYSLPRRCRQQSQEPISRLSFLVGENLLLIIVILLQ